MKTLVLLMLLFTFCSSVQAVDRNGTYTSNRVQCYDPMTRILRTSTPLITGQEVLTIIGDQLSSVTTSPNCEVHISAKISFTGTNQFSATSRQVNYATNKSCKIDFKIDIAKPYLIFPISFKYNYVQDETLPDMLDIPYEQDVINGDFGHVTLYKNAYSYDDVCFIVYSKK